MKLFSLFFLVVALSLPMVVRASFDVRHQYLGEKEFHSSRMKMGYKLENDFSFDVEIKFRSKDQTKFMDDLEVNEKELTLGHHHKINDEWILSPGMPVSINDDNNKTYKPQLRLTYKPKEIKTLSLAGRYRLDIKPHETVNRLRHRFTYTASYKPSPNWSWGYEGNYYYSDNSNYLLYDNDRTNYEHNIKINFLGGAWSPYIEFGNVSVSSTSDHRELRARAGLRYSFNFYERDKVHSHLD